MAKKCSELTLCILKPPVVAAPQVLKVVEDVILGQKFQIIRTKTERFTFKKAAEFYSEHDGKFFYNRLVTFMTSGPCAFYVLAKDNAIQDWRNLLGPTKVYKAQFSHPDSLRGIHGLTDTRNVAHGSDSMESAAREIRLLFPELDLESYQQRIQEEEGLMRRGRDEEAATK